MSDIYRINEYERERKMFNEHAIGLYRKFRVTRTNVGLESVEDILAHAKKHEDCDYFVIDLVHDKYARNALAVYATNCEHEYPALAADLKKLIAERYNHADGGRGGEKRGTKTAQARV